nr:ATP-binding protein [uncultured Dethiosulfovibrio sp.]
MFDEQEAYELVTSLLKKLNKDNSEHQKIEAKKCENHFGNSALESVCAFANEIGIITGYLLLGVEENKKKEKGKDRFRIIGVNDNDISAVLEQISTRCKQNLSPSVYVKTHVVEIDGKKIICLAVPEADPQNKPVQMLGMKDGLRCFRRSPQGDYLCTAKDLQEFYDVKQTNENFDQLFTSKVSISDLSSTALSQYREKRREVNEEAKEIDLSDEDLLMSLDCARSCNGIIEVNNAGLLLFGKPEKIKKHFPMNRIDIMKIDGSTWVENPDERFIRTKEIENNILEGLYPCFSFVNNLLPKKFYLPPGQIDRKDQPIIDTAVTREAIVNAIMHRDYRAHCPIQIRCYDDRLEVENAGYSLKPIEKINKAGSRPRNPLIARILHEINIAETKGTGINTMIQLMEKNGLKDPDFDSNTDDNSFKLTCKFEQLLSSSTKKWIEERYSGFQLNDDQKFIIMLAKKDGYVSSSTYREAFPKTVENYQASREFKKLCDLGILTRKGAGKATTYELK